MSVKIFYSYAHEDKELRTILEKHLSTLKQQNFITQWHDRNINAGQEWAKEVNANLNTADIILLLISPDFLHSDYCSSVEMKRALERYENGTAEVIPVLVRHVDYDGASFSHLQVLPTDAIPVTDRKWRNRDEAFLDVARGIRKAVKQLLAKQYLEEGNIYFYRKEYQEALSAFERATSFDPTNALAYIGMGQTLNKLGHYRLALDVFEKALPLAPTNVLAYEGKAKAFYQLASWKDKAQTLDIYEVAIAIDPEDEDLYIGQAEVLSTLYRYEEALTSYEKAIEVSVFPNKEACEGKAMALYSLKCYEDAIDVYNLVIKEFPDDRWIYNKKGDSLYALKRYEEALEAYEKAISLGYMNISTYTQKGNALNQLGYYQKALEAFETAITMYPDNSFPYIGKGEALQALAQEAIDKAEKIDSEPLF